MTRQELLIRFIKENDFKVAIEVGAAMGWTTKPILQECNLDCFIIVEREMVSWNEVLYDVIKETDVVDEFGRTQKPIMLLRMASVPASKLVADRSIDLVFIDAGHGYECIAADIQHWMPKARIGGIICGHDWDPTGNFEGVVRAVEEAFPHYEVENDSSGDDGNHVWWLRVTEEVVESVRRWTAGLSPTKEFAIGLLFNADVKYQYSLDAGIIPTGLRQEFDNHGVVLSENAVVVRETSARRWLITDGNRKYPVVKEGNTLEAYNIMKPERAIATEVGTKETEPVVVFTHEVVSEHEVVPSNVVVPDVTAIDEFFERYPLLQGFSNSWKWTADVNHANPFYSPLYYLICRSTLATHILEIGCENGYSSYMLATAAKENGGVYYCIEKSSVFASQLSSGLAEKGFPHVMIWADSKDISDFCWAPYLDFVLLDGEHSVEAIQSEFELLYPKLRPGSYVALHDVNAWSAEGFQALIHNPAYDFEYVTFPQNYGLALLRKREEDWDKVLQAQAAMETNREPAPGWMYVGESPAEGRVVVISSSLPNVVVESMDGIPIAPSKRVREAVAEVDEAPLSEPEEAVGDERTVIRIAAGRTRAEAVPLGPVEPSDLEGVPKNLEEYVVKLGQRSRYLDL